MDLARTNRLLAAAGYSQQFSEQNLHEPEMKLVKDAVVHLINAHMPYPALLIDQHYNLLTGNAAQIHLFECMIKLGARLGPDSNLFLAFFEEDGLRPFLEDREALACHMLQRIHQEHLAGPYRDQENTLLAKALELSGIPQNWQNRAVEHVDKPILSFTLKLGVTRLKMFSTISSFGTPLDITAQQLRVEHLVPADDNTKLYWQKCFGK